MLLFCTFLLLVALTDALPMFSKYSARFGTSVVAVDTTPSAQKRQNDAHTPSVALMSTLNGVYKMYLLSQPW